MEKGFVSIFNFFAVLPSLVGSKILETIRFYFETDLKSSPFQKVFTGESSIVVNTANRRKEVLNFLGVPTSVFFSSISEIQDWGG
ncbi:hypothetical protein CH380_08850 [Leptospira adleri]|uniref:Uncharacterized protein n=1 Tax=Leptospira adleri TaxID=2023186 RepID=A0A2M9YQ72_9LEPT|nr:hypothetical protein CH380_08850 [Leptospira adleri]PJZ61219.1 hypothetical protein CH376_14460 [Leptospira adleri]